ncbi:MAG: glycosyltransferase family 2 protein [bacterium]|nr:glycosyltransferase family 2 protein [bacterium]
MNATPRLSIIIVNWNVAALLMRCIQSILDNAGTIPLEIIVVDSASTDDSMAQLARTFPRDLHPQIMPLPQRDNVGFTGGNNIGIRAARGDYLFLLNPDTEIMGDALQQMIAYLDGHPETGIVGPHTLNPDGSYQSTRRYFPSLALELRESLWVAPHLFRYPPSHYPVDQPPAAHTHRVDWLQGSALMARRAVYEQIGGLDSAYFMFSEETDWCRRAADAGWQIVYIGSARIVHHGGGSTQQVPAFKHIQYQSSKVLYFRKHHGVLQAEFLRGYILLNYAIQLCIEAGKGLIGHKRGLRRERVRLCWQVIRSGLRK